MGSADNYYMTQRSSAELIIITAGGALGLYIWQYITQLWLIGDTAYDKPGDTILKWAAEVVSLFFICGQRAGDSWKTHLSEQQP